MFGHLEVVAIRPGHGSKSPDLDPRRQSDPAFARIRREWRELKSPEIGMDIPSSFRFDNLLGSPSSKVAR